MKKAFAYVTDERGFELTAYSSIFLAFSQPGPVDIHFFCYRFVPKLSKKLSDLLERHQAVLAFHDIQDPVAENHPTSGHVTTPTLLKLLAVETLIDTYDLIVYLDSDILVFDRLNLESIGFQQRPMAAVIDMDLSATGALRHSVWSTPKGKAELGDYFNAGVMVFQSATWLKGLFYDKYLKALNEHDIHCRYKLDCTSVDQCTLNYTFENNWAHLPLSYNMQAGAKFTPLWKNATVRHYCGTRKFMPLAPFRSDGREVRRFNEVDSLTSLLEVCRSVIFEGLFRLNRARNRRAASAMMRFLEVAQLENA